MDAKTIFNFSFDHWPALLLSFIPAIITLGCIVYMYFRLPGYKQNNVYILFLVTVFVWQINDSLSRASVSIETARAWDKLLAVGWMLIIPSTIHFTVLITGRLKLSNSNSFIIALYLSGYIFVVLMDTGFFVQEFIYTPFWGWVKTFSLADTWQLVPVVWVISGFGFTVYLMGSFAYQHRHDVDLKFFSLLIFFTYFVPGFLGMITQVLFPTFMDKDPIPLTSTGMLTIVLVITGLTLNKKFNLSETIDSEHILDIIQEMILVVSSNRDIAYMNSHAKDLTRLNRTKTNRVSDIFQNAEAYEMFDKQVLEPSFKAKAPCSFQICIKDNKWKEIYWDINSYPILNKKVLEGVLLICTDITDHVHISEARLTALRSQMNPHFIFNSLNSIQHYIHDNKKKHAESFLLTFSNLIKKILDNSTESFVPLANELDSIKLYLELEKLRFGGRLEYEIVVSNNINIEQSEIPSMLIQPYIENAIIHGIANKEKGGKVTVRFSKWKEAILCIVEDDGIGREKSLQLKQRLGLKVKSHAMSITRARLELLNQHLNPPVTVNINNLTTEENQAPGTRVQIYIPLNIAG